MKDIKQSKAMNGRDRPTTGAGGHPVHKPGEAGRAPAHMQWKEKK